jgi:hypothetical protein
MQFFLLKIQNKLSFLFSNSVAIVFKPTILLKNFKKALYKIQSLIFKSDSFFVLKVNFNIFSKVSSTMNFYLKRINDSGSNFLQSRTFSFVLVFMVFLTGFIAIKATETFLTMKGDINIHIARGARHDNVRKVLFR